MAERYKFTKEEVQKIKRPIRAFHEMKHSPENGYVFNFDTYNQSSIEKKKMLLIEFGFDEAKLTTPEVIERAFLSFKAKKLDSLEKDVGEWS